MRFLFLIATFALAGGCLWSAPPAAPAASAPTPPPDKVRTWKDTQGRVLEAAMRGYDAADIILWLKDGRVARVSLQSLSAEDQYYAVFHAEELAGAVSYAPTLTSTATPSASGAPVATMTTPVSSAAPGRPIGGVWPTRVVLPISSVQCRVISEDAAASKFVYQTGHFEYRSEGQLGQAVMSDVSRIFEATFNLLSQSPWGVLATPEDGKFFRAELFETRGSYIASGAPPNSGGVYLLKERVFRVPFESLGLKQTNRGWTKDENYGTKTLVHELTHMLQHDILPLLPMWAAEGMAEYAECIPFRSSTFWVDSIHDGVKEYNRGKDRSPPPPVHPLNETLMMTTGAWHFGPGRQDALYHSGLLLVYYFTHLEGDGKGTRFLQFLEALRKDAPAWRSYQEAIGKYEKLMEGFMKQPGVKDLGGGRFSYPAGIVPPHPPAAPFPEQISQVPFRHLDILLNGKTAGQVATEAAAALKKAGLEIR